MLSKVYIALLPLCAAAVDVLFLCHIRKRGPGKLCIMAWDWFCKFHIAFFIDIVFLFFRNPTWSHSHLVLTAIFHSFVGHCQVRVVYWLHNRVSVILIFVYFSEFEQRIVHCILKIIFVSEQINWSKMCIYGIYSFMRTAFFGAFVILMP